MEINIERALQIPGWMSKPELTWLAEQASKHWMIAEIGSWRGRSTRALADHSPGMVYAVDNWKGSPETANDPDFCANPKGWLLENFRHNLQGCDNVMEVQCSSVEAAARLAAERFDMIFIDGAHDYDSVKADLLAWRPLLAEGGILCGHDYADPSWPGVQQAVNEIVSRPKLAPGALWFSTDAVIKRYPVTIVVLGKYSDIFAGFYETANLYAHHFAKILVRDGHAIADLDELGWTLVQGPEEFSMAGNGNIGLRAAYKRNDILYCGDDIRFLQVDTVEKLAAIARRTPELGILSPKLIGRGSAKQVNPESELTFCEPSDMWFPCVYIKRELIEQIGYLDEQFCGFGSDDLDYCLRAQAAGFKLAVTNSVSVVHEGNVGGPPTTFERNGKQWQTQQVEAQEKLRRKQEARK